MQARLEKRRCPVLLIAAILVGFTGCGGSASGVPPKPSPTPRPILADCRGSMKPPTGSPSDAAAVQYVSLTVGNKLRDYRLFRPPALDYTKPVPLVISLHGTPSDASVQASVSHFDDEAAKAGFLAVYPDGCDGFWDADAGSYDVGFISRLIDRLRTDFRIDEARVFIVGVSAGALMAYRIACELSSLIAGLASVAGSMLASDCHPARPVSILEMHGTADANVSYALGVAAIQTWTLLDGCVGDPALSQSGITKTSVWSRCNAGTVVRLDTVEGGHHTWFGSTYDPVPNEPNANSAIWSFFSSIRPTA
jgi:polyhydroxybutyrate depolymerase